MKQLDPQDCLQAPPMQFDTAKARTFAALYRAAQAAGQGCEIRYDSPYPKYEFLTYLVEHEAVLLHGSNNPSIAVLQPKEQTNYLGEWMEAIFATADGLWPMFFAILDREVYQGTLRNGCYWVVDPAGRRRKCYHFSINAAILRRRPWVAGMIYILPRAAFEREQDPTGEWLEEWISREPVRPIARLAVAPADFPFLAQIEGHDEHDLARLTAAPGELFKGFHDVVELEDGYALCYAGGTDWDAKLMEFIRQQRRDSRALTFELVFEPEEGPIWLRLRGAAGLKAEIHEKLHTFLDARNVPG